MAHAALAEIQVTKVRSMPARVVFICLIVTLPKALAFRSPFCFIVRLDECVGCGLTSAGFAWRRRQKGGVCLEPGRRPEGAQRVVRGRLWRPAGSQAGDGILSRNVILDRMRRLSGVSVFVEDWGATYGPAYLVHPNDTGSASAELVEDGDQLVAHVGTPPSVDEGPMAFVDGVRRGEASLWQETRRPDALPGGSRAGMRVEA